MRRATGSARHESGSAKIASASSAIITIAPGPQTVTGWPPSSGTQIRKTTTARRVGAVIGAARSRLSSTLSLPLELLVDGLDRGVQALARLCDRRLQPALRGEDRARVAGVDPVAGAAQRGAIAGDLPDEPAVQVLEAAGRVDRAEVLHGGAHGVLIRLEGAPILLGRAGRRDPRAELREPLLQAGLRLVEGLDVVARRVVRAA